MRGRARSNLRPPRRPPPSNAEKTSQKPRPSLRTSEGTPRCGFGKLSVYVNGGVPHGVHLGRGGGAPLARDAARRAAHVRPGSRPGSRARGPRLARAGGRRQARRPAALPQRGGPRGREAPDPPAPAGVVRHPHAPHERALCPRTRPRVRRVAPRGPAPRRGAGGARLLHRRRRAGCRPRASAPRERGRGCAPLGLPHLRVREPRPRPHQRRPLRPRARPRRHREAHRGGVLP